MNKLVSVALAGVVAAGAIAATAGSASAGGWKPGWNPGWQQHHARPHYPAPRPYNPGPAIVTGTILGFTLGALAAQPYYYSPYPPPPPPPPVQYYPTYYGSEHFNWCAATYDNYNSQTDTWTDFRGVVRPCIGP